MESLRHTVRHIAILFAAGTLLGVGINLVRSDPLPWLAEPRFSDILPDPPEGAPFAEEGVALLAQLLDRPDVVFVDLRPRTRYETFHIPNALSLPAETLSADPSPITAFSPEWLIVLYGEGKEDSERVESIAQILFDSGLTHLRVMRGGIAAWRDGGFPVLQGGGG